MKNKYFNSVILVVFILINTLSLGQVKLVEKTGNPTTATFSYERPINCALNTSMLISDYKQNRDSNYLKVKYNLIESNSTLFMKSNIASNNTELFVDAFIKVSKTFDKKKSIPLEINFNEKIGDFYTARIPLKNLEKLFKVEGIINVEIAEKVKMTLDNARASTNVNQVQNGTGLSKSYTGKGVIVGVIDNGFDYTHPTFYSQDNTQYRINRVWEQMETGTPPSGLTYGNEIIGQTNILNKGYDLADNSHGTHVAGTLAGSGGTLNSIYKGVAYESEIVLVSSDLSTTKVLNGIQYIFNYANSVNKPAVINMSIASNYGPHDGTSTFDLMCNNLIGNGKILVGSAGNNGSDKIHVNKKLSTDDNLFSFVRFPYSSLITNGITGIDIWGEAGQNFEVAVNIYNTISNEFESYTPYINTSTNTSNYHGIILDNDSVSAPDGCIVDIVTENKNINNNKPHAVVVIDNREQDDDVRFVLLEVRSNSGTINAWLNPGDSSIFSNLSDLNVNGVVTDGDTNMTVGEIGGTGNSIISVGAYNTKGVYTNFNGNSQATSFPGTIGNIATFSSKGPTSDGRVKPDITAPGNVIISSVNHYDTTNFGSTSNKVASGITDGTTKWWFGAMSGTSMASPMVAGIIALWLQAVPTLTVEDIKSLLNVTSITDNFTGTGSSIPNNIWGRGKINALSGMLLIEQALNLDTFNNSSNFVVYPNPTLAKIFVSSNDKFNNVQVYNTLGQNIMSFPLGGVLKNEELDLSSLSRGTYILKFSGNEKVKSVKIVKE